MIRHRVVGALLLAGALFWPAASISSVAADSGTRLIQSGGTATLVSRPDGPEGGVQDPEFALTPDDAHAGAAGSQVQLRRGAGPSVTGAVSPAVDVNSNDEKSGSGGTIRSFNGLNFRQQRLANGGNQFSVEPPDQGLCVGNNFVLETVNSVLRVFDKSGNPLTGVVDLNSFYGYPAAINRATGVRGPSVTDPSCWFDAPTQRWFHVVLTLDVFPNGRFTGANHLDLAVSQTSNPTGTWKVYRVQVQDDGQNGTPNHGCEAGPVGPNPPPFPNACIGDFPHLGADANGIYITTNEYCLFCPGLGFHAAQVYAFSKQALVSGAATVAVTQIDTVGALHGQPGFTLWPATSPTAADFERGSRGTEYFTSSNAAEEASSVPDNKGTSNEIGVWALTNTASLASATPALKLTNTTVRVSRYGVPPLSNQKPGSVPLAECINDTKTPTIFGGVGCWTVIFDAAPKHDAKEGPLDSSDTRVLSTVYASGLLYGTLDTSVRARGKTQAGVLYYIIRPELNGSAVSAELEHQGHISPANNNAIYGTVAATHAGQAIVGFTLVGDSHYPSAAYVSLGSDGHASKVIIAAEGLGPQDGFTEYDALANSGTARPRWGDYGAAVADGDTIWLANEYIAQTCTLAQYMSSPFGSCGGTRATLGNWGTRITAVDASHRDSDD